MSVESDLLKTEITSLKATRQTAEDGIEAKRIQAITLIRKIASDLLTALRDDRNVSAVNLQIVKKRALKNWVFEIYFNESDLVNRSDFKDALADINDLVSAANLDTIVKEEQ